MKVQPGSMPWLLRHELRLYWRSGALQGTRIAWLVVLSVLLHLCGLAIALGPTMPRDIQLMVVTSLLLFTGIAMLSRALFQVIDVLHTRNDMELLLTAPIEPGTVVGSRAAGVAASVTLESAFMLWPFANMAVLFGYLNWLKAYLLVPALGMLATCIALALALFLYRRLGPRRARVLVQVMSGLIGVAVLVVFQLPNMMRARGVRSGNQFSTLRDAFADWVWQPGAMILDAVWPTLLFCVLAVALFATSVRLQGFRFLAIIGQTAIAGTGRAADRKTLYGFRGGLRRVLILKEMRLIARDPLLLMQLFQQVAYLIPFAVILWRQQSGLVPWTWLLVILVCGSLATALGWICFATEDASDLLVSAPVRTGTIIRAKLEAILLLLGPLLVLPLLFLWHSHLLYAMTLSLCAAGCAICCILLTARRPASQKRSAFRQRYKGKAGDGIIELLVIAGWTGLCVGVTWLAA
jgi:ABC-2 type transport system permease protein